MSADSFILNGVAWLGTYMIHSTLFLGVAWLLTRQRMLRAPRLTERIWRLALFGGLLTASIQVVGGTQPAWATWILEPDALAALPQNTDQPEPAESEVRTSPEANQEALLAAEFEEYQNNSLQEYGASTSTSLLAGEIDEGQLSNLDAAQSVTNGREAFEAPMTWDGELGTLDAGNAQGATQRIEEGNFTAHAAHAGSKASSLPWKDLILGAWISAAALGLMGFLWACSCLLARMSKRRRIVGGPLLAQLEELRLAAGLRHEVKLFASATLDGPIAYGWLRPRICVPLRALSDLSPSQQRSMLAHELAHVKRNDPLWFSLYTLVVRVLCLQPMNRLARGELLESAELLCDDWAVRWTGQRLGLASCLTEIAQWILGGRKRMLISAGMAEQPSRLGVRVERLLDDRRSPQPEPSHSWWSPTALASLILFTSAAPGFSSTPLAPEAKPELESSANEQPLTEAPLREAPEPESIAIEEWMAPQPLPVPRAQPLPRTLTSNAAIPTPLAKELALERSLLDDELNLLQLELDSLRIEIAGSRDPERYQPILAQAEWSLQKLRQYQERLNRLLPLTTQTSTHPK